MNTDHLRQLWGAIGTLLVFYAMNAWIVSQGGNAIFDVDLIEDGPRVGALVAIPICSVLLIGVSRIGSAHARHRCADEWHSRLPVVWLEGLDTSTSGGRWYQRFFLTIFVIIPSFSLVHFVGKVLDAPVRHSAAIEDPFSPLDFLPIDEIFSKTYWIGGSVAEDGKLHGAVSWYPVIEPIVLFVLVLAAWVSVAAFFRDLFSAPRESSRRQENKN